MHIAVAGNIGSGKTTLTNMLSKHYGWETHFEDVDHNPYLNDFYHDMQRWSFNLQIISGERVACSKLECLFHKLWSPKCQP